jgi:hypothetical protein
MGAAQAVALLLAILNTEAEREDADDDDRGDRHPHRGR